MNPVSFATPRPGGRTARCHDFELIIEFKQPIAAICPQRLSAEQLVALYAILPESCALQHSLAKRWSCAMVIAPIEWAIEQLGRSPCLPRHGLKLAFVS